MILYFKNTRLPIIPINEDYSEKTIYKAIIKYANFTNDEPIPDNIAEHIVTKPDMEEVVDEPFETQFMHIKNTGFTYDNNLFKKIL